jgi:hypothetical protein
MSRAKVYFEWGLHWRMAVWVFLFSFELTKQIQYGKENILSVRLENKEESSDGILEQEFTEM